MGLFDNYRLNRALKRIDRALANLDAFQGGTSATDLAKRRELEAELSRHKADQLFLLDKIADRLEADYQRALEMNNRWALGDRNFTREDIKWALKVLGQHASSLLSVPESPLDMDQDQYQDYDPKDITYNAVNDRTWNSSSSSPINMDEFDNDYEITATTGLTSPKSFAEAWRRNRDLGRNSNNPNFTYNGKLYGTKGWNDFLTKNMSEEELKKLTGAEDLSESFYMSDYDLNDDFLNKDKKYYTWSKNDDGTYNVFDFGAAARARGKGWNYKKYWENVDDIEQPLNVKYLERLMRGGILRRIKLH